jgi:hypothetical protein
VPKPPKERWLRLLEQYASTVEKLQITDAEYEEWFDYFIGALSASGIRPQQWAFAISEAKENMQLNRSNRNISHQLEKMKTHPRLTQMRQRMRHAKGKTNGK